MPEDKYIQFIPFSVSESDFSTLTEEEINLEVSYVNMTAIELHAVTVEPSMPGDIPDANGTETLDIFITTQPVSEVQYLNDEYVIYHTRLIRHAGVDTYKPEWIIVAGCPLHYKPAKPILLVQQKIYVYIKGTSGSVKHYVRGRLEVTYTRLSKDKWREAFETWAPTG